MRDGKISVRVKVISWLLVPLEAGRLRPWALTGFIPCNRIKFIRTLISFSVLDDGFQIS